MHLGALALALVLSSIAVPLAVDAQQPGKLYRIGMLERTSTAINAASLDGFRQGLRELGYVEELDETDQAFAPEAEIFESEDDRSVAEAMCREIGSQLFPDNPLGWEDLQSVVVFPDSVPNATLPIFWRSGTVDGQLWKALFDR